MRLPDLTARRRPAPADAGPARTAVADTLRTALEPFAVVCEDTSGTILAVVGYTRTMDTARDAAVRLTRTRLPTPTARYNVVGTHMIPPTVRAAFDTVTLP